MLTSGDPGFENSQLQVSGGVSLGGSALDIELLFIPSPADGFVIIENDGADAVVGTFAGLPEAAVFTRTGLTWRITYAGGDGNDVALTLVAIDFHPTITSITVDAISAPGFQIVRLSATCVPRATYDLEVSTNLMNWARLSSYAVNSDGIINPTDFQAQPLPRRFYRLKLH